MSAATYYLLWDDLLFDHDVIRIKPNRIKAILQAIPYKGAMASLNAIKEEYFVRHYNKPIKLVFEGSALSKSGSPAWAEINALIEKAIEVHRFSGLPATGKRRAAPAKKAAKEAAVATRNPQEKPGYLKVLARLQHPPYKLITIHEKQGGQSEESHIYRLATLSGRVLIVWENTRALRAAYLFMADEQTMHERLAKIEAFIATGDVAFKRSRFRKLKENATLRTSLCFIGSVHHDSSQQFESEIKTYLNRY